MEANIVKISGGLGNQLFQYAFGKYLEVKNNLPSQYYFQTEIEHNNFTKRAKDLMFFFPNINIINDEKYLSEFIFFNKYGLLQRVERKLNQIFPFLNRKFIVQKDAHSKVKTYMKGFYDGYWQHLEYVNTVKKHLLENIKFDDEMLKKNEVILSQINTGESVSIHIRRDDYINIPVNAKIYEVCDLEYYNKAIKLIKEKVNISKFFVFSQDKEWVRQNFVGEEFVFVDGDSAIEDFLLMSACKHNIIANSTFSWWSSYLNKNENKIIISPKKWYKNKNLNKKIKNLTNQKNNINI